MKRNSHLRFCFLRDIYDIFPCIIDILGRDVVAIAQAGTTQTLEYEHSLNVPLNRSVRDIVDKALYLVIVKIYSLNGNSFNPKYGVELAAPYALLWVALMVYVNQRKWREYITFDTLLFIWSCLSMRMTPLFVLISLTSIPSLISRLAKTIPKADLPQATQLARRSLQVLVVICLLIPVLSSVLTKNSIHYPVHAISYLKANPCKGNLFNSYNFGGFLIWQLPNTKVYIDGRMPSWRYEGKDYMATYNQVLTEKSVRDTEFSRFDIRCAVIENTSPLYSELRREGWNIKSTDNTTSVLTSY